MIRTLAIDTSTKTASVALLADDVILYEATINVGVNHSIVLLPAIDEMMRLTGQSLENIDLFACTTGPGSFTGLRIGAGTIKGFAMAAGKPIAGVSTLDALSLNAASGACPVCPLLDARKGQVYTALYKPCADGHPVKIVAEQVTSIEHVLGELREFDKVIFLGDGAQVYREVIVGSLGNRAVFLSSAHQSIRASAVGLLGMMDIKEGRTLNPVSFTPHYLRLSEAEMKQAELS